MTGVCVTDGGMAPVRARKTSPSLVATVRQGAPVLRFGAFDRRPYPHVGVAQCRGSVFPVAGCGDGAEITAVRWESSGQLRLFLRSGEESGQMGWYAVFDVEEEKVVVQGSAYFPVESVEDGGT